MHCEPDTALLDCTVPTTITMIQALEVHRALQISASLGHVSEIVYSSYSLLWMSHVTATGKL